MELENNGHDKIIIIFIGNALHMLLFIIYKKYNK